MNSQYLGLQMGVWPGDQSTYFLFVYFFKLKNPEKNKKKK